MLTMSPSSSTAVVGDAVADDLVDRGAQRLGKALVAQRRRVGAVVEQELVADPVDLVGGDAGGDDRGGRRHGLGGDPAGHPHPLDGLGVLDLGAVVARRRGPVDVLRPRDGRRHRPPRGDHVRGPRLRTSTAYGGV